MLTPLAYSIASIQPWHDIHSAVRGPETVHLIQAFEERWRKQADDTQLFDFKGTGFLDENQLENSGGWCAQLSRSIDSRMNEFDRSKVQSFKPINIDSLIGLQ